MTKSHESLRECTLDLWVSVLMRFPWRGRESVCVFKTMPANQMTHSLALHFSLVIDVFEMSTVTMSLPNSTSTTTSTTTSKPVVYRSRFTKVYQTSLSRPIYTKTSTGAARGSLGPYRAPVSQGNRKIVNGGASPQLVQQSCEEYVQFKKEEAKYKDLAGQLAKAKTASEKEAISEMLKLTLFHIKDLQKSLTQKHSRIQQSSQTSLSKINRVGPALKRPSSVMSTSSYGDSSSSTSDSDKVTDR